MPRTMNPGNLEVKESEIPTVGEEILIQSPQLNTAVSNVFDVQTCVLSMENKLADALSDGFKVISSEIGKTLVQGMSTLSKTVLSNAASTSDEPKAGTSKRKRTENDDDVNNSRKHQKVTETEPGEIPSDEDDGELQDEMNSEEEQDIFNVEKNDQADGVSDKNWFDCESDESEEEEGPKLCVKWTKWVNKYTRKRVDKQKSKEINEKWLKPKKVVTAVPKINAELYSAFDKRVRFQDANWKSTQSLIYKSVLPMVYMMDKMAKDPNFMPSRDELIENGQETIEMGLLACQRMSQHRRAAIKPSLGPKYKKLCENGADIPVDKFLFGPNLSDKAKEAETATKLTDKLVGKKFNFGKNSKNSYPNYQRNRYGSQFTSHRNSAWRGRGGATRGQNFRNRNTNQSQYQANNNRA